MDARNNNRYRMLTTLQATFASHKTDKTWTTIPALVTAVGDLDSTITRIATNLEAEAAPNGASATKEVCLDRMIAAALEITSAVHACAVDNDNAQLAAQVDFSETDLRQGREMEIVARCSRILSLATEQVSALADYNIVQADLTAFGKLIDAYAAARPKPRQGVATKSAATQALQTSFSEARQIMDARVHKLMLQFRTSAPDFFAEYQTARKIVDQPGTQGLDQPAPQPVLAAAA